ncbi:MAG: HEPN domain-containing protein, partial [Defluviitaleaceae bacterium]|nr:HEPN domain-containing protein [Defluviitaleaceae bacterium]
GEHEVYSDMDVFVMVEHDDKTTRDASESLSHKYEYDYDTYLNILLRSIDYYMKYYWETVHQNIRSEGMVYYGDIWRGNIIMLWNDKVTLSKVRFEAAQNALQAAINNMQLEDYWTSVVRSYYAAYSSIRSLLILEHKEMSKHYGNISEFRRLYIATNIFKMEFSDYMGALFKARNICDYEPENFESTKDNAEMLFRYAKEILDDIGSYLNQRYEQGEQP